VVGQCPLYPQKRTFDGSHEMPAKGQKLPHALQHRRKQKDGRAATSPKSGQAFIEIGRGCRQPWGDGNTRSTTQPDCGFQGAPPCALIESSSAECQLKSFSRSRNPLHV